MSTKDELITSAAEFIRIVVHVWVVVLGGLVYALGYLAGIIWIPFAEGMDDGMDFVDEKILDYIVPDEEDEL